MNEKNKNDKLPQHTLIFIMQLNTNNIWNIYEKQTGHLK